MLKKEFLQIIPNNTSVRNKSQYIKEFIRSMLLEFHRFKYYIPAPANTNNDLMNLK